MRNPFDDEWPHSATCLTTIQRSLPTCRLRIQLLEKVLAEAKFFFDEDFPNGPYGKSIATPRYRKTYQRMVAALTAD